MLYLLGIGCDEKVYIYFKKIKISKLINLKQEKVKGGGGS